MTENRVTRRAAGNDGLETDRPSVSVIIPVYNNADRLARCLAALEQQTYPYDRLEIVVVDNGSQDHVAEVVARFERVRLLREPRPGSYTARNRGIRETRAEFIAFTDADCLPSPTWIERGIGHLARDTGIGLVGGRIDVVAEDPQSPTGVELADMITSFQQRRFVEELRFAATASLFTRRSVFERVGVFNEDLMSGGDREWGGRVHAAGLDLRYAEDVVTAHPARRSFRQLYTRSKRLYAGARDRNHVSGKVFPVSVTKLLRNLVPPVRTAWRMRGDHRVPTLWAWVRLVAVVTLNRIMSAWFTIRFAIGGKSPRQ